MAGPRTPGIGRLSLRWRLVLLVVAGVVPLLAFSFGYEYLRYREDVAATGRQTVALAHSVSLLIEKELQVRIAALQTLAVSGPLQAGDFAALRVQAETVVAQQFPGSDILLLKRNGQQVINTNLPPDAPLPIRPNLETTRQVFATGRPAVSNLFQGAVSSRPVVAIDVPVKTGDGTVIYDLSLVPPLEVFAEAIRRQDMPASWVVSVLDRRGVNIARVPDGARFVGHEASPGLLARLQAAREGVADSASREEGPLLSAFSHADGFGWAVAIGVPRAALTEPALSAALSTLAVGGLLLAVGLALALYAARRIAGPIESLSRLATAQDRDAVFDTVPTGLREVDEVAHALQAAENARRRSRQAEQLLIDSIEAMPVGFVIYDDEDRLVMCNRSYREFLPESAASLVPRARFEDILRDGLARGRFPGAKGREADWLAEQLRQHHDSHGTVEHRLSDGRWVFVTKSRLANGNIAGLCIDVTELKRAEQALAKSEDRFRSIYGAVSEGIFIVSPQGAFTEVNEAGGAMFGYAADELIGSDIEKISSGGTDGVELASQVQERWPTIRAVFTSGFPETSLSGSVGSLGPGTRLLSKPYRKEDLASAVRAALDG